MSENSLQYEYVRAILDAHFRECMSERMRTTSHIRYIRHAPVFSDSPPHAIPIHLFVIMRNKQVIGRRMSARFRSEEHTSELQSRGHLVCSLLLERKKNVK